MPSRSETLGVPGPRPLVTVLVIAGLLVVPLAGPASAHARFEGSDPAEGAVLVELPGTVVMSYSEQIAPQFLDTAVVPPGGEPIPTPAVAEGTDVTVDLGTSELADAAGTAGNWQVVARVVSADGHPIEHTTTFVVEPAAPAAATPSAGVEPGPTLTAKPEEATERSAEPSAQPVEGSVAALPTGGDPVAGITEGLPGWLGVLLLLAVLAAAGSALALALRRRRTGA